MKRKFALLMAMAVMVGVVAVGCNRTDNPTEEPPVENGNGGDEEDPVVEIAEPDYMEDLEEQEVEEVLGREDYTYFEAVSPYFILGSAERGYDGDNEHYVTFQKIYSSRDAEKVLVNYSLFNHDRAEIDLDYVVEDNKVVEYIYVDNDNVADAFNTIIAEFVVLEGDVELDARWEQTFEYQGETYTATTTITYVGDETFETTTVVEDIELFEDNVYREFRTYELGKGLVAFERSHFAADVAKETPMFSYRQN